MVSMTTSLLLTSRHNCPGEMKKRKELDKRESETKNMVWHEGLTFKVCVVVQACVCACAYVCVDFFLVFFSRS